MENQEQIQEVQEENDSLTLEQALGIVIDNLGNICFPSSVLASMSPDQIVAVKQLVIDPVERARRNVIEILAAYEEGKRAVREQAEAEKATKKGRKTKKEVVEDGTEVDTE